jgi:hypothetical protein
MHINENFVKNKGRFYDSTTPRPKDLNPKSHIVARMKIYPELNKVTINEDDLTLRLQCMPTHPMG